MYEALILDLKERLKRSPADEYNPDFCRIKGAYEALVAMNDLFADIQAENTEKDQIIEALTIEVSDAETILDAERKHNIRVEAERDAAAKEIPHTCMTCAHGDDDAYCNGCNCDGDQWNATEDKWTWRGAQGEG